MRWGFAPGFVVTICCPGTTENKNFYKVAFQKILNIFYAPCGLRTTNLGPFGLIIVLAMARVEIKLYKVWSIWVITFFGHNCHFVQNSLSNHF